MATRRLTLVDNWKQVWRHISTQGLSIALAIQGVWITLPDDWRSSVDSKYIAILTITCLVVGVIGKFIKQPKLN